VAALQSIEGQHRGAAKRRSVARGGRRALVVAAALVFCAALASAALAASADFHEARSSPEATGDGPRSIAVADLDGDGDQDLATTNYLSDDVTILKGSGGGNFFGRASSPETAGAIPFSIAAADLDGDGDRDLAVANADSDNVTILRNNGAGNFAQRATSPAAAGDGPSSVVAADLDGDGDRDLAVANLGSDDVTILKNSGSGKFSEPDSSPEAAGSGPFSVVAADLDGDGDQDLAVASPSSDNVTILRNNGVGNFAQPATSPEAVGAIPYSLAAADLDGDGDQDLAVANTSSDNVTILRNNGVGNFAQPATSPEAAGAVPFSLAAADLDGDGDQDLAVANEGSDDVTILKNNGAGNFGQPDSSPEAVGTSPSSVVAADLDGDGDRDLAVANFNSNNVTILRNR
jgi:hypothetical protein